MKLFLISILAFSFLVCDKSFGEDHEIFTITNKANDHEPVFVYLYDFQNPYKRLQQNECLKLTESQFDQLEVRLGRGGRSLSFGVNVVCSPKPSSKCPPCQPSNYEILDIGDGWYDEYVLIPVDRPNTSNNCIGIEKWMVGK